MSNSTFSGNSAEFGGGIRNVGALNISHSTFAGNRASAGAGIDIVTAAPAVFKDSFAHSWTDEGLKRFCNFWDQTKYE